MAEVLDLVDNTDAIISGVGGGILDAGSAIYQFLIIFLLIIILGGLGFYAWWYTRFKFHVQIREQISNDGHYVLYKDKARRIIKNGTEYWKFRRRRALVEAPNKKSLQITNKGRFFAECVHEEEAGSDAGYRWIIPSKDPASGDYCISMSQNERNMLVNRIVNAQKRKSRSTLDIVMQFAGMSFVLMILILVLAFYGEIAGSVNDAAKEVGIVASRQADLMSEINEHQERINDLYSGLRCEPKDDPPLDLPLDEQSNDEDGS